MEGFSGIESALFGIIDGEGGLKRLQQRMLLMGFDQSEDDKPEEHLVAQTIYGPNSENEDEFTNHPPRTSSLIQHLISTSHDQKAPRQKLISYRAGDFSHQERCNNCNVIETIIYDGDGTRLLAAINYTYHNHHHHNH